MKKQLLIGAIAASFSLGVGFASANGSSSLTQYTKNTVQSPKAAIQPVQIPNDLWHVFLQAQSYDPAYKAALATKMQQEEALPLSISNVLPQLNFDTQGGLKRTIMHTSMASSSSDLNGTTKEKSVNYDLSLTQSIFNFAYWKTISSARNTVKAASATYSAAYQDLMLRVATAYFDILDAQDKLRFTKEQKIAFYNEYLQADQSYKVGIKTITDVYNAKASYDSAVASYIEATNSVAVKKENLRAITNKLYENLYTLKAKFPLAKPVPTNINQWVQTSSTQNWSLTAAKYKEFAARENIMVNRSGHLPTLDLNADYKDNYARTFHSGYADTKGPSVGLEFKLPLFQGGAVNSNTRKAIAAYEQAASDREKIYQDVVTKARQSYLSVISGISQVSADKQTVISSQSSLDSTREGYKVGTNTMVDVLLAQRELYNSQKTYATDRYQYVIDLITLKNAAGTLSPKDLLAINTWLENPKPSSALYYSYEDSTNEGSNTAAPVSSSATANTSSK